MAHMERERILIITHSYTPFLNPRAYRWSAVCEHWVIEGKQVDVIASWLPGLRRFEILNGVEVHRVGGSILERLRAILRPKSRSTVEINGEAIERRSRNIIKVIGRWVFGVVKYIHDKVWKNLYWPDYACSWIAPAVSKGLELCEMIKYSTVISVSDPFSSHIAGKKIKRNDPDIKWLVDIGDPFCFRHDNPTNNHNLYRKLNYRKEHQIFELADCISVTTENTRKKYAELFSGMGRKIKVIPPLMTVFSPNISDDKILSPNKKIKLVYVGTLYRSIRNPEYLLNLFEVLASIPGHDNVELHFFGGFDDCRDVFEKYRYLFGQKLFLHGLVNRSKVMQAMKEADILVNIGNNNPYQLPSKLVEYVTMEKPILNLHTIDSDSSKEFLDGYPALLNLHTCPSNSIYDQAHELGGFIKSIPIEIDDNFKTVWRGKFGIEQIASEYFSLLQQRQSETAVTQ